MAAGSASQPARLPRGVVGIISQGDSAEAKLTEQVGLQALGGAEIRADLLLGRAGTTRDRLLGRIRQLEETGVKVIFTPRLPEHGGVWDGTEAERVALCREALQAGAHVLDLEWGSEAARSLAREKAPLIVSHHDFSSPIALEELEDLAQHIASDLRPSAIKIVPTARRLVEALDVLEWVAARPEDAPERIGFAMGASGAYSRVLSVAFGAPFTYAPLTSAVAPGQLSATELLELYRVPSLTRRTRLLGVLGSNAARSFSPYLHNPAFHARDIDAVYLPFQTETFEDGAELARRLGVGGLSVTIPFKSDAFALATVRDARSERARASNTLIFGPDDGNDTPGEAPEAVHAYNTDFDGVILPLGARLGSLEGVSVAVIGAGGAARGAIQALKEAGCQPALYFRNAARGTPVARELGVPGATLAELAKAHHSVFINATPLGSRPDDPSPVPREVIERAVASADDRGVVAFEMVYEPARTAFLREAESAGAATIPGRDMLVAQGTVQFELFTGQSATLEEFTRNYEKGERWRRG